MLNNPQLLQALTGGRQIQSPMPRPQLGSLEGARGLPGQQGSSGGLISSLLGLVDSRGPMGQAARGTNVYQGTSPAPRVGKRNQIGGFDTSNKAISQDAIARRLKSARSAGKSKKQLNGGF